MSRFSVSGMTCGHCVAAVTRAVEGVDPAAAVAVDLARGEVEVRGGGDPAAIVGAIARAGYAAAPLDAPPA